VDAVQYGCPAELLPVKYVRFAVSIPIFHKRVKFSGFTFVCRVPVMAAVNLPGVPVPVSVPVTVP
jgi:hypothetical protein